AMARYASSLSWGTASRKPSTYCSLMAMLLGWDVGARGRSATVAIILPAAHGELRQSSGWIATAARGYAAHMKNIAFLLPLGANIASLENARQGFLVANQYLQSQGRAPRFAVRILAATPQ